MPQSTADKPVTPEPVLSGLLAGDLAQFREIIGVLSTPKDAIAPEPSRIAALGMGEPAP